MNSWTADDFSRYFEALHGISPFPWQRRLASVLLDEQDAFPGFPELLDIPTGLGKTSVIDLALFFLAARPEYAPRRILYVIDRRIVVDQAADRARSLLKKLMDARDGILADVAASLRKLFGGSADVAPFEVSVMRGGMPRDEAWAERPDRPVVVLGTVDQIGSRLLFHGYGVSASMAPVHAGLLGHDALFLLDEVQLSTAFAETLASIARRYRRGDGLGALGNRWSVVQMSATPIVEGARRRFGLNEDDFAHPIIRKRLGAKKRTRLVAPIQTSRSNIERSRRIVVQAFVSALIDILATGAVRVAIIVNRVDTALAIHRELMSIHAERFELALLTGRMRPLDRDNRLYGERDDHGQADPESLLTKLAASDEREALPRPLVVVATQTLEAGADFDFDALITECASFDALKQRFGRLDRRGLNGETRGTILIQKDQAAPGYVDPIYGDALTNTWAFLNENLDENDEIDFGIEGLSLINAAQTSTLTSPITRAPVLLPAHLDAFSETQPRPSPAPETALFLHGPRRGIPEVRLFWRADVDAAALNDETLRDDHLSFIESSLAIAPASSLESLSLPLPAFRAFIESSEHVSITDVEGVDGSLSATGNELRGRRESRASKPFLLVEPQGVRIATSAREAYPEATILLPSSYGGLRDGNWDPEAEEPVRDLGDEAQFRHRGKPVIRLSPAVLQARGMRESLISALPDLSDTSESELSSRDAIRTFLQAAMSELPSALKHVAERIIRSRSRLRVVSLGESGYFAATSLLREMNAAASPIVNDDSDGGSFLGREIALDEHLADVRLWVRRFTKHLGLPEEIGRDLELAARLHDIGKADPRFQRLLRGGAPARSGQRLQLIAKSTGEVGDRVARELAQTKAQYPKGYRHEILSVAMLEAEDAALASAHDRDLVLHLVGSHHGWGRPFAPAVSSGALALAELELDGVRYRTETNHGLASVGSPIAERFWRLNERYGWWTLAFFEALLRLADHRASEEESARSRFIDRSDETEGSDDG